MDTTTATHNDAGIALVNNDDMIKALQLSITPENWTKAAMDIGTENPVLLTNVMAMGAATKSDEFAAGYFRGFVHCYMALRNAEERCRKERV